MIYYISKQIKFLDVSFNFNYIKQKIVSELLCPRLAVQASILLSYQNTPSYSLITQLIYIQSYIQYT